MTATPDTALGDIAAMLERNRIKRVPIVEGTKIVGIVSRANILQAFATAAKKLSSLTSTNDLELRKKVIAQMEPWTAYNARCDGSGRQCRFVGACSLDRGEESCSTGRRTYARRSNRYRQHQCSTRWDRLA
jgi:hypothetical protein